jgi:hypothetical protein
MEPEGSLPHSQQPATCPYHLYVLWFILKQVNYFRCSVPILHNFDVFVVVLSGLMTVNHKAGNAKP